MKITEYMVETPSLQVVLKVGQRWGYRQGTYDIICFLGNQDHPKSMAVMDSEGWCVDVPVKIFAREAEWISSPS